MKKICLFLNANSQNELALDCIKEMKNKNPEFEINILTLEEKLPEYTGFPSQDRKERLEQVLSMAAQAELDRVSDQLKEAGVKVASTEKLAGRFPEVLTNWLQSNKVDLLVKEPLISASDRNYISKGDRKLLNQINTDVLLVRESMFNKNGVLVGVAAEEGNAELNSYSSEIIDKAVELTPLAGEGLAITHSWWYPGQELLTHHMKEEEWLEVYKEYETVSQKNFDQVLKASQNISKVKNPKYYLENGDPTRVLSGLAEALCPSLIVLGSVARTGISGYILGNTAETIASSKPISIYIHYKK